MNRKIIVLGTGGNCLDILDTIAAINASEPLVRLQCIGFLDDDPAKIGTTIQGVKVLGPLSSAVRFADNEETRGRDLTSVFFVNGIGSPHNFARKPDIIDTAGIRHDRFLTLVDPRAVVSPSASLGFGTVVFPHVTICSNAKIGNHVIILPNSVISHDDVIGDYASIASGACISGGVTIGRAAYVGTRAAIIGNVTVGDGAMIGMGSVVLENVPPNAVVAGSPARLLRYNPVTGLQGCASSP